MKRVPKPSFHGKEGPEVAQEKQRMKEREKEGSIELRRGWPNVPEEHEESRRMGEEEEEEKRRGRSLKAGRRRSLENHPFCRSSTVAATAALLGGRSYGVGCVRRRKGRLASFPPAPPPPPLSSSASSLPPILFFSPLALSTLDWGWDRWGVSPPIALLSLIRCNPTASVISTGARPRRAGRRGGGLALAGLPLLGFEF